MNPIIDPNIFWCAEIYGCFKYVMAIATICLILINIFILIERKPEPLLIGAVILTAILFIIVPSESTYYKMSIAKYVTLENVKIFENNAKELVDYIADTVLENKDTKK